MNKIWTIKYHSQKSNAVCGVFKYLPLFKEMMENIGDRLLFFIVVMFVEILTTFHCFAK